MKNNKFYEMVKSLFLDVGSFVQFFRKRNIRPRKCSNNLEDIKNDIYQIEDIEDILDYVVEFYNTYYSINRLNILMNSTILCRKQELNSKYSFKIMVQLYLYLMIKNNGQQNDIVVSNELEIFQLFLAVIQNNISNNQVEQSVKCGRDDNLQSYLNYHFDFRKELWEYYEIVRIFDIEAHEKYGFSIYQNFDKLLYIIYPWC